MNGIEQKPGSDADKDEDLALSRPAACLPPNTVFEPTRGHPEMHGDPEDIQTGRERDVPDRSCRVVSETIDQGRKDGGQAQIPVEAVELSHVQSYMTAERREAFTTECLDEVFSEGTPAFRCAPGDELLNPMCQQEATAPCEDHSYYRESNACYRR